MQEFLWHIRLKLAGSFEEIHHILWRYKVSFNIYKPKFFAKQLSQGKFKYLYKILYYFIFLIELIISLLVFLIFRKFLQRIVFFFIIIGALIYSYFIAANYLIFEDYKIAHQRFHGTGVYDKTNKFLGIIPPQLDPQTVVQSEIALKKDHTSLYITHVPDVWWEVLKALEDRHIDDGRRSWSGIDVVALAQRSLGFLTGDETKGASSLAMMLVRSMRHENANPKESKWKKLQRKFTEILHAPILFQNLYPHDFKKWLAMHVPLVNGTPGSKMGTALYGIGVTARIIFGKPPEKLTLAEQALLAAAFKKPILLAPFNNEKTQKMAQKRWEYLKARAKEGVTIAYANSDSDKKNILAGIKELKFPTQPHSPVKLARLLPKDEIKKFGILANPYRRSLFFAHGEMIQAIAELQEKYGSLWREQVYAIHLSTDAISNVKFKRKVENVLQKLQTKLQAEERLYLDLLAGKDETAQVILALADADGKLLRYYSNSHDSIYSGEQIERKNGHYNSANETRQVASLAKLAVAVLLGAAGDNANKPTYCNKAVKGVHNPGLYGSPKGIRNCSIRYARYSPRIVFARSLNLPIIFRLKTTTQKQLKLLIKRFGLTLNQSDNRTPLSTALTLGLVNASPHTLHGIIHAIATGIVDGTPTAFQPSLVRTVQIITEKGLIHKRKMPPMNNPDISGIKHYFAAPNTRSFVKTVLSGVFIKQNLRGTLSALEDWTPEQNNQVQMHIAKTGTSTLVKDNKLMWASPILDKYIVGAVVLNGKLYSYLVLVGNSNPKKPLGKRISGNQLSELVRVMLTSVITDN